MYPYREARTVIRAALAGDRDACGKIELTFKMAMSPGPNKGRAELMAYLLQEALQDERAERPEPSEIEVREVVVSNDTAKACSVEHPEDIPCEDCAGTFVRSAKRAREARV